MIQSGWKLTGTVIALSAMVLAQPPGQTQPPWSEQLPIGQPQYGPGPNTGDPNAAPQDTGEAPDRGVARISFISGSASVRRGDSGELVAAGVNAPLVAGDRIVTPDASRAEVQFDALHLMRVAPQSEVRLGELAYHRYQIQVAAGTAIYRIVRDSDAQVEISTPSVAMRPLKAGVYRISVNPDGTSEITVRVGDAEVFSPRGSEPLHAGQTMIARGSADDPEFQLSNMPAIDDFENWSVTRDRAMPADRSNSQRYVSPDAAGTADLDNNGRWVNDGSYGNVWVPQVDPGWAPYSCGRWVLVDYYGWSWVGCESWGWAPYHYGRWYYSSFGWAWWPGPIVRPWYWRPALVGFFGWGGGVGFGFGFGNIGWCPLAPFEFFHPWYGRGFYGGFRGVNVVNVNVFNTFHNARFGNAITSVRGGDFGHGAIGRENILRAQPGELARAGAVHGQLPMSPTRESTMFSNRAAVTNGAPRTNDNMRFASHMQTAQTNRVSFEQQRSAISQGISRGASGNAGGFGGASRTGAGPSNNAAFGSSNNAAVGSAGRSSGAGTSNGGWQHFDPSAGRVGGASGAGSVGVPGRGPAGVGQGQPSGQGRPAYTPQPSYTPQNRGGYSQPQNRGGYSQPQAVHINPPMVQNRGSAPSGGGGSHPSNSGGGSHPSGGGGGASHGGGGGGHGHK